MRKDCFNGNFINVSVFNKYFPQEKVYLHFDNTGYFRGETIWFKAYIVRTDKGCLSDLSHVLYVELVTPGGDVVATEKLCVRGGMAHGSIRLDGKVLESGFYEVRAYTRYMTNWDNGGIFSRVFPIFNAPKREGDYSHRVIAEHSYVKRLPDYREPSDTLPVKVGKLNARFYPEGGNLVDGLTSTVAFDISNEEGAHVTANVYVMSGNDTITVSETEREGRGVLRYMPSGEPCRILVTDSCGRHREFSLPEPLHSGYVLSVNTQNPQSVMMHISSTPDLYGKTVCWLLTHNGVTESADTARMDSDGVIRRFLRSYMKSGVNQLTLIDSSGHVIADRLFFNYPVDGCSSVLVTCPVSMLSPCKKVPLAIRSIPESSLSLSVLDASTETNGWDQNISTWMLLTSDLKGYIEHPGYYLEKDDARHRHAADLLMLVQGWRRYDMTMMTGQKPFVKRQPVEDALYVDGQLHQSKKRNTVPEVSLSVTLYNSQGFSMKGNGRTDAAGYYAMKLPDCEGDWTLYMYTRKNDKLSKYNVGVDRHFSPPCRSVSYGETQTTSLDKPSLVFNYNDISADSVLAPMDKRNHILREVKVKGHHLFANARAGWENEQKGSYYSNIYYNCADAADELADRGENMPEIHNWLGKRNPFFHAASSYGGVEIFGGATSGSTVPKESSDADSRGNTESKELSDADSREKTELSWDGNVIIKNLDRIPPENHGFVGRVSCDFGYKNRPVIWILNNMFYEITGYNGKFIVDNVRNAVAFSNEAFPTFLDEVKSLYISEDENVWWHYIMDDDLAGYRPVTIFVYSFHEFAKNVKGLRRTHFEGFAKPETFKMNDYSKMPPEADYRRTLYWNPDVTTDSNGNATVEFYNNSSCRQMIISAEGITKEGMPVMYKNQ